MPDYHYAPPDAPIAILHQDDHVLVVDKPAGLLSVPGREAHKADCVITRLKARFPQVLLVHRLDCDTSGVMVFALSKAAQGRLGQQFEKRQTQKTYIARVWGRVSQPKGHIDLPLCVDWPNRPRHHVNEIQGKPAMTDYEVLHYEDRATRIALRPVTGRSHQLRVHMLALGHPILGDLLYAEGSARDDWPRMMLHAQSLSFAHPVSGTMLTFHAPDPF